MISRIWVSIARAPILLQPACGNGMFRYTGAYISMLVLTPMYRCRYQHGGAHHGPYGDEAVLRVHEDHEEQRHRGDLLRHSEGVYHVEPQVRLSNIRCRRESASE